MPSVGDPCWRDSHGLAALELPWRIFMPDGTTRTDPAQWSADPEALAASGWEASTLTQADIDAMNPMPPSDADPVSPVLVMT